MSLRRTALQRRSELRRTTPMRRARRERATRAARTIRSQSGPSRTTRALVAERAAYSCERCGQHLGSPDGGWLAAHSFHHRQPRGSGGSSAAGINDPSNLLLLCGSGLTGCHGWIESNRTAAYEVGWLVRTGFTPGVVPVAVWSPWHQVPSGGPVYLTEDGHYLEAS